MSTSKTKIEIAACDLQDGYVFELPKDFNATHVEVVESVDASDTMTSVPKGAMFIVKIKATSGPFKGCVSQVLLNKDKTVTLISGPKKGFLASLLGSNAALAVAMVLSTMVSYLYFVGVIT